MEGSSMLVSTAAPADSISIIGSPKSTTLVTGGNGFEATMSAAMELESTLKIGVDQSHPFSPNHRRRQPTSETNGSDRHHHREATEDDEVEGRCNVEDIPIRTTQTPKSNGHNHHHHHQHHHQHRQDVESSLVSRPATQLQLPKQETDEHLVDGGDLMEVQDYDKDDDEEEEDEELDRHSLDINLSEGGHCSYGDDSDGETSKDGELDHELDNDVDLHNKYRPNSVHQRNGGLQLMDNGSADDRRPESVDDGVYYDHQGNGGDVDASRYNHLGGGGGGDLRHRRSRQRRTRPVHHADEILDEADVEDDGGANTRIHQCHLCAFSSPSKLHFTSHVNTHYDHKCSLCEYRSRTEGRLKRHIKDSHADLAPEVLCTSGKMSATKDGSSPPGGANGNGNGKDQANKNKAYKCKQCNYMATVKSEFWAHTKSHIKAEKLLACPRCPFVTEYKHHLEYHLRNHFGSKPFKCPKCSYSCVNKSMLNSHMKSHSNVYQYRCADCTYATKYCHSLKLHLRKYTHVPATVLNLDGTPNPMPIIDVYGTRRGPRPKKNQTNMYSMGDIESSATPILDNGKKNNVTAVVDVVTCGFASPLSMVNGGGGGTAPPYFYSGASGPPSSMAPPPPVQSNGFHVVTTPQDNCKSNNVPQELMSPSLNNLENGKPGGTSSTSLFKCNLCEFATDHNDLFSKHMLLHAAAENQDLCNLYGFNSESLLQDPNQQQQLNMAAMAAALGMPGVSSGVELGQHNHHYRSGGVGFHSRPSQLPSPQGQHHQQRLSHHQQSVVGVEQLNSPGSTCRSKVSPSTASQQQQHPLEHLKAFSEHVNIQPFVMRDFSLSKGAQPPLFPSSQQVHGLTTPILNCSADGSAVDEQQRGRPPSCPTPEKFLQNCCQNGQQSTTNKLPSQQQQQQQNLKTSKNGQKSLEAPKESSPSNVVGCGLGSGLGPLDLSNAKLPMMQRHNGPPFYNINKLKHHFHSPFQHFGLQQQMHNQQQQLQQQHLTATTFKEEMMTTEDGSAGHGETQETSPNGGAAGQECSTQKSSRRKGKAFKLDRICLKLHKDKGPPSLSASAAASPSVEYDSNDEQTQKSEKNNNQHVKMISKEDDDDDDDDDDVQDVASNNNNHHERGLASETTKPTPSSARPNTPRSVERKSSPVREQRMSPDVQNTKVDHRHHHHHQAVEAEEVAMSKDEKYWKEAYKCQYCNMAFQCQIMYTVHMGYHGFKDPFKCNMCGQQTNDKVAFFLHIARTAHL